MGIQKKTTKVVTGGSTEPAGTHEAPNTGTDDVDPFDMHDGWEPVRPRRSQPPAEDPPS